MPRYRNDGSMPLNFGDSGGPWVEPGETFTHDIPENQRVSMLGAQIISVVDDIAEPADTEFLTTAIEVNSSCWPTAGEEDIE